MKTAHINAGNEFGGGLVHIVSLLCALEGKGHSAELIVLEDGPVAQAARQRGLKVIVFEQKSRYDLRVLTRLLDYVNSQGFDIIHTHGPRANLFIRLLSPFLKAKWVTTIHSNPYFDFKDRGVRGRLFEKSNTFSYAGADAIITVSNEIRDLIRQAGVKTPLVETIHNGIAFSDPLQSDKIRQVFTLIMVGRLHKVKNHELVFKALSTLEEIPSRLVICGEGEESSTLRESASKLGDQVSVDFRGWLGSEELKQTIREADVLLLPSRNEGFPLVLLEAAEQEVPVIASDVGDVKAIVDCPQAGWLIRPDDLNELTSAIKAAYIEWTQDTLSMKGKQLREQAISFSLSAQAEKVIGVYQKLI